jgi:hypothetical protein
MQTPKCRDAQMQRRPNAESPTKSGRNAAKVLRTPHDPSGRELQCEVGQGMVEGPAGSGGVSFGSGLGVGLRSGLCGLEPGTYIAVGVLGGARAYGPGMRWQRGDLGRGWLVAPQIVNG